MQLYRKLTDCDFRRVQITALLVTTARFITTRLHRIYTCSIGHPLSWQQLTTTSHMPRVGAIVLLLLYFYSESVAIFHSSSSLWQRAKISNWRCLHLLRMGWPLGLLRSTSVGFRQFRHGVKSMTNDPHAPLRVPISLLAVVAQLAQLELFSNANRQETDGDLWSHCRRHSSCLRCTNGWLINQF